MEASPLSTEQFFGKCLPKNRVGGLVLRASDPVTGSRASPRGGRVGGLLTSTDIEFELLKGWAPPTEVGRLLLSAKRHSPLYLWLPACSLPTVLVRTTGELWSTQRHTGKLLLPRRAARRARPECGAPSLTIHNGLQDGGIATPGSGPEPKSLV